MKRKMIVYLAVSVLMWASSLWAQGSLDPADAPGVMMKTLDQVEPRMPIPGGDTAFTITAGGSYYLTSNRTAAITIAADHVTLDLMGYMVAPTNDTALRISGNPRNMRIFNGVLCAPGGNGVDFSGAVNADGVLENLRVFGCQNYGMVLGSGFSVRDCVAVSNGIAGIETAGNCKVTECRIENNPGNGLVLTGAGSYIADNFVKGNGDNYVLSTNNQVNILLCEIPETLDWPCKATFAGTLMLVTNSDPGIVVSADHVTIDLAGHALIGPGVIAGNGIEQGNDLEGLTIRNGVVSSWQGLLSAGIRAQGKSTTIENVTAITNKIGLFVGENSVVKSCVAANNLDEGIFAHDGSVVLNCTAFSNASYGIWATEGCSLLNNAAEYNSCGFSLSHGTIQNCSAVGNSVGIDAGTGSIVRDCAVSWNDSVGIDLGSDCLAVNNICQYNNTGGTTVGMRAFFEGNRLEGNSVVENDIGIQVVSGGNYLAGNTASQNGTNWVVAAGNVCLVVQAATNVTAFSGDAGGTAPGSTDPRANFSF